VVVVYAITSLPFELASPARLADLLRGHWSIEALHRRPPAREYHRRLDGEQEARLVAPGRAARQDYEYERR